MKIHKAGSNQIAFFRIVRAFLKFGVFNSFRDDEMTVGETLTVGGVTTEIRSARLLATNQDVSFRQKGRQLIFTGLPPQFKAENLILQVLETRSDRRIDICDRRRRRCTRAGCARCRNRFS